jgi:hypothetical protein
MFLRNFSWVSTRLYILEGGTLRNDVSSCVRADISIREASADLQIIEQREAGCHCVRISLLFIAEVGKCAQEVVSPLVIESSLMCVRIRLEANRRAPTDTWRRH